SLDPAMMWEPLLKGFCAAILGGLRSLRGAVIGGVLLGLSESFFGFYVSLPYKSLLALVFVILALWLRPQGLTQSSYASKL
ncbi:MAG: branched-chain amino acid ABC transporter permease, partial [Bacteroidota bacterium]